MAQRHHDHHDLLGKLGDINCHNEVRHRKVLDMNNAA